MLLLFHHVPIHTWHSSALSDVLFNTVFISSLVFLVVLCCLSATCQLSYVSSSRSFGACLPLVSSHTCLPHGLSPFVCHLSALVRVFLAVFRHSSASCQLSYVSSSRSFADRLPLVSSRTCLPRSISPIVSLLSTLVCVFLAVFRRSSASCQLSYVSNGHITAHRFGGQSCLDLYYAVCHSTLFILVIM